MFLYTQKDTESDKHIFKNICNTNDTKHTQILSRNPNILRTSKNNKQKQKRTFSNTSKLYFVIYVIP